MRCDRSHRLVEQRHARSDLIKVDQAPALANPSQRRQLRVVEPVADLRRFGKARVGSLHVALEHDAERGAVAQVSLLDAITVAIVQQPLSPVHPPATAGKLALVQENEGQPEDAAGGAGDMAELRAFVVRAGPDFDADLVLATQVRRHSKPLKILEPELCVAIRGRQLRVRVLPRAPFKRFAASVDPIEHGDSLVQLASARHCNRRRLH